jgi:phage pi2 protein 07
MKNFKILLILFLCMTCGIFVSCSDGDYGANPYDPNTPITVSQLPKVLSFLPTSGESGDTITIKGINFSTASNVAFGGKSASSFNIINDSTIEAVVSQYGGTGTVAVTNKKGTRSLAGFLYIKPVPVTENPNLSLNSVVTGSEAVAGAIGNVNDGDLSTVWQAKANVDDWIMIDLGKVKSINTVRTKWDKMAPASEGELQISEDGVTFTTIKTWTDWIMIPWTSGPAYLADGILTFTFDNVNARYVRLAKLTNKSNPPYNLTLKEFEIYNTPPPTNLSLNCMATGSEAVAGAIGNINDGDESTLWQAKANVDDWVMIDLGKVMAINSVTTIWDKMAPASEGELQISEDGVTFTTIKTWTGWIMSNWNSGPAYVAEGILTLDFDEVNARYVKLAKMTNKSDPPYNLTLKEFEIFKKWK